MNICDLERGVYVHELTAEDIVNVIRRQLAVLLVGNVLYRIAHNLAELCRQRNTVLLFKEEADTALAALAVDTDNVAVVLSADILGVDRQVGH